jgi:hypothetical protein
MWQPPDVQHFRQRPNILGHKRTIAATARSLSIQLCSWRLGGGQWPPPSTAIWKGPAVCCFHPCPASGRGAATTPPPHPALIRHPGERRDPFGHLRLGRMPVDRARGVQACAGMTGEGLHHSPSPPSGERIKVRGLISFMARWVFLGRLPPHPSPLPRWGEGGESIDRTISL